MKSSARGAYARAGVDVKLADEIKRTIARQARSTFTPDVAGKVGFFGGFFRLRGYKKPILVSSTDGVGTKLKIASLLGRHDTVGIDLVNHCVNDILCCGAEPLFFLDYIAMGRLNARQVEDIISGIAKACQAVHCPLIGGELAEMPGIYSRKNYDLVGFIVGAVEQENVIDGSSIAPKDALLGLPSSGLHTNGYSLVRKVFSLDRDPSSLEKFYPELGQTLGEELMKTHRCYYHQLKPVLGSIKGIAHITGGGLIGNIPRILPRGLAADIKEHSWDIPAIFRLIQELGKVERAEMYNVFNMGIGMVIVCSPQEVARLASALPEAKVMGEIVPAKGKERVIIG